MHDHKVRRRFPRRAVLLVGALAMAVPVALATALVAAVVVLTQATAFSDFRRNLAARVLSDFLVVPIAIEGDVDFVLADPLQLRISKVQFGDASGPEADRPRPVEIVEASFPLWPALAGRFDVSALVLSGGRVNLTGQEARDGSADVIARVPARFLNARVSDHLELREIDIRYQDASGWAFELEIDGFSAQRSADGGEIVLDSRGALNGLAYSLTGRFPNPRGGAENSARGPFHLAIELTGLTAKSAGSLDVSHPVATIDAEVELAADSLATVLALLRLDDKLDGKGSVAARLTGPLDAVRVDRLALDLSDTQGRTFALTGSVADLVAGAGIDLSFEADLIGDDVRGGAPAPIVEIDVTGFKGRIAGSLDRLVLEQIFLFTNVAAAELKHIGPIGLERIVRDADGRLGFLGIRVLEGPKDNPIFDFAGEITDVLDVSGIAMAGRFNISLLDVLMAHPAPQASDLGRLKGSLAVSDASGALRLEAFVADVQDTELMSLAIRKVAENRGAADRLALHIDLDVPDFGALAELFGGAATVGAIGFTGKLVFPERHVALNGKATSGRSEITVETDVGIRNGAPFVSANLASDLLYLADIERGVQVYKVFSVMDNEAIGIEGQDSFVRQTRVELALRVAEFDADGIKLGNIHADGHYADGIVELDPVRMSYLAGTVDGRVRVDTNRSPAAVAFIGQVGELDMASLLAALDLEPLVTGALSSTFDLSILAGDRSAIASSLNGKIDLSIRGGRVGDRLIDLGGQNVMRWMFSDRSGTGEAKLVCAVAALNFDNGRGASKSIVVETEHVQVIGAGEIDLAQDSIALSFTTRPKRHELIDVATPFSISGKLSEPVVKLAPGTAAGRVLAETLTAPFNILGLLLPHAEAKIKHQPCVVPRSP